MTTVSDSTPLIHFGTIKRLDLLRSMYGRIATPYTRQAKKRRIIFPFEKSLDGGQTTLTDRATDQATDQDDRLERVLQFCTVPRSRMEIQEFLGLKHRRSFKETVLQPLLESGLLIQTVPDKPSSPKQRYISCSEHEGNES